MSLEIRVPDEYTGPVTGDLNRRRGMIKGMDMKDGENVINADVPLSELFSYIVTLRTLTKGRASASMSFSHYQLVPQSR